MLHFWPLSRILWSGFSILLKFPPPGREKQDNLLDGEKPRMQKNLVPYGINNPSMFYKAVPILIFT